MRRFAHVLRIRPDKLQRYRDLHAAVWPEILRLITACNIRNYTIHHHAGWLFSRFDYVGTDFAADMLKMDAAPINAQWQAVCRECQAQLVDAEPGEWWREADEVFYCAGAEECPDA